MEQTTMDKQDETNYGIVIKKELIIEDDPILYEKEGLINEAFVKKEKLNLEEDQILSNEEGEFKDMFVKKEEELNIEDPIVFEEEGEINEILIKQEEELITEDEPILSKQKEEIDEMFVKKEEELIIEDELDPLANEDEHLHGSSQSDDEKDAIFTCSICQETFEKSSELARHVRAHKHKSKQLEEFNCEFCGKSFYAKTHYNKHLIRHRPRIFKCDLCPKSYPEKSNLARHLRVKHKIQTPNSANNISSADVKPAEDFALDDENIEQTDSTATGGKKDPTLYCEQCDRTFKAKRYCDTHKRKHRNLEKGLYRCIPCKKFFVTKYTLDLHEKSVTHKRIVEPVENMEFYCAVCDKVFPSKVPFTQHMRRHRPRDFQCNICSKSFPENCNLTRHLRNVHMVMSPTQSTSKVDAGNTNNLKEEPIENELSSLEEDDDPLQVMPQAVSKRTEDGTELCCETCNKVFKYRKSYEGHMQRHAFGAKFSDRIDD